MADKDTSLYLLRQSLRILPQIVKEADIEKISPQDRGILQQVANRLYAPYFQIFTGQDPGDFSPFFMDQNIINQIIAELEKTPLSAPSKKTPIEETSIPPELESLVAEYQENQATLDEIEKDPKRSVAEQVKIALKHADIRQRAIENRLSRQNEKFANYEDAFVDNGSPKDGSYHQALNLSYNAIQRIAFTFPAFESLDPRTQNQIISQAVDLHLAGVRNLDIAVETAALQINHPISGGYITSLYQAQRTIENNIRVDEQTLLKNEYQIDLLQQKNSLTDTEKLHLQSLLNQNTNLNSKLNKYPSRYYTFADNQQAEFEKFQKDTEERHSKEFSQRYDEKSNIPGRIGLRTDIDLDEQITLANSKVASIHSTLLNNGVKPIIHTDLDRFEEFNALINQELPGRINTYSTYEGAQASVLIGGEQGLAVAAYSKGVGGAVLREAEKFAAANPNSKIAGFLKTNSKFISAAHRSVREVENSVLGKEILQKFSKANQVIGFITNPVGTFKAWVGKKVGQEIALRLTEKIGNVVLKKAATTLLNNGLKQGIQILTKEALSKMAAKAATWAATKLGLSVALQSLNAIIPGFGFVLNLAVQALILVAEKTIGYIYNNAQKLAKNIYGEEVKARDFLGIPIATAGTALAGMGAFVIGFYRATRVAAASAVGVTAIATVSVFILYVTTIAVAPLISTLAQLESASKKGSVNGCISWPTAGNYRVGQGPDGLCTHHKNHLQGVDIEAPLGDSFLAVAPGVVSFAGVLGTYGNTAIIASETPVGTINVLYAHMIELAVGQGQSVNAGDEVGLVGGTGGWSPHIHFEFLGGAKYNECPAGDTEVPDQCCNYSTSAQRCQANGADIYTNQ